MTGKAHKKEFHGKYRGTVMDNHDLEFRGRITAMVPDVLGLVPTSWATPCVPVTGLPGLQSGVYAVPPIGASVWIEFEHGDPDFPVWVGCYWGSPVEVPVLSLVGAPEAPNIVLQSVGQNVILMSGDPVAGITLSCGLPLPTLPPPIAANGPCVTAIWTSAATCVFSYGMPVLLQDSQAICAPSGTPLLITATQTSVFGM
jgi:hypothetical protein